MVAAGPPISGRTGHAPKKLVVYDDRGNLLNAAPTGIHQRGQPVQAVPGWFRRTGNRIWKTSFLGLTSARPKIVRWWAQYANREMRIIGLGMQPSAGMRKDDRRRALSVGSLAPRRGSGRGNIRLPAIAGFGQHRRRTHISSTNNTVWVAITATTTMPASPAQDIDRALETAQAIPILQSPDHHLIAPFAPSTTTPACASRGHARLAGGRGPHRDRRHLGAAESEAFRTVGGHPPRNGSTPGLGRGLETGRARMGGHHRRHRRRQRSGTL